jgi:hypothetical protein
MTGERLEALDDRVAEIETAAEILQGEQKALRQRCREVENSIETAGSGGSAASTEQASSGAETSTTADEHDPVAMPQRDEATDDQVAAAIRAVEGVDVDESEGRDDEGRTTADMLYCQ